MLTLGGYELKDYVIPVDKKKEEITMINAADARKKADESIDIKAAAQIRDVEGEVIAACEDGKTSIVYRKSLTEKTIVKLQELGYEVVGGSQYNERYYVISWTGDWRDE